MFVDEVVLQLEMLSRQFVVFLSDESDSYVLLAELVRLVFLPPNFFHAVSELWLRL